MAVLNTYSDIVTADGTEEFVVIHSAVTKNVTASVLRTYTLGNGFVVFAGPTTSNKTFTLPNVTSTILTTNDLVTVAQGGTGRNTATTAYGLLAAGTTAAGVHQTLPAGATTDILVGGGASALPAWTSATGTGAPVRATGPTIANLVVSGSLGLNSATLYPATNPQTGVAGASMFMQANATLLIDSSILLGNWHTNTAGSACLVFAKSINGAVGSHTAVTDGATLGRIAWEGSDGDEFLLSAGIEALAADTATNGLAKGKLNFLVTDRTGSLKVAASVTEYGSLRVAAIPFTGPALSTTVSAKLFVPSSTYTDNATAISGTVAHGIVSGLNNVTIAATNTSVTYTNLTSFYIDGPPLAGTNVTATNRWSLYIASGASLLAGNVRIGGTSAPTNALSVTGNSDVSGTLAITGASTLSGGVTATIPSATVAMTDYMVFEDVSASSVFSQQLLGDYFFEVFSKLHRGVSYFLEDFLCASSTNMGMEQTVSGTGAAIVTGNAAGDNLLGIIQLGTGTTATGRASVSHSMNSVRLIGGKTLCEFYVSIQTLSDGTNTFQCLFGFFDTLNSGVQTDAACFIYDSQGTVTGTASANWQVVTSNAGTKTYQTTSTAVGTGYVKLGVLYEDITTDIATFYVNDVSVATSTATLPGSTAYTGVGALIIKTLGATERTMRLDYVSLVRKNTTDR